MYTPFTNKAQPRCHEVRDRPEIRLTGNLIRALAGYTAQALSCNSFAADLLTFSRGKIAFKNAYRKKRPLL